MIVEDRMVAKAPVSRRTLIGTGIALAGVILTGCSRAAKAEQIPMTVYRDPNCGCCEAWAAKARQAGFDAKVVNDTDMPTVKRKLGVPEPLASCHTAVVGDFAIEGHVPLADVKRLLSQRPAGVRGIAVPGMPAGSPGMEVADGTKEPFKVVAFDAAGRTSIFSTSG